jgi:hypothetical protein
MCIQQPEIVVFMTISLLCPTKPMKKYEQPTRNVDVAYTQWASMQYLFYGW